MRAMESVADAFVAGLADAVRSRFDDRAALATSLALLHGAAQAAYPEHVVDATTFAGELARRLGELATPEQVLAVRADHLLLAIAGCTGDEAALRRLDAELVPVVAAAAARLSALPHQVDDVRSHVRRVLFASEPGRPAALQEFSGRGDLRSYVRVIATRELVRVINQGRRGLAVLDEAVLNLASPTDDPALAYLRERYRSDVDAAMRAALIGLADEERALLRYSLIDGWTVDRIGALYGVHRATAARRVAAARAAFATAIRSELAGRLAIPDDEVDSIIRLVQSRIDASIERLLA
jgi:RNA polymerase sigma-70 factor (ECF subfamily)